LPNQHYCAAAKAAWLRHGFGRGAIDCVVESLPLRALFERADLEREPTAVVIDDARKIDKISEGTRV
jgi:hypothetical protein